MNKKALLGKLLILAIIIIIIMGTTIYFQFSKNSVKTTIGKVSVDVSYNSNETKDKISIVELPEEDNLEQEKYDYLPENTTVSNLTKQNITINNSKD